MVPVSSIVIPGVNGLCHQNVSTAPLLRGAAHGCLRSAPFLPRTVPSTSGCPAAQGSSSCSPRVAATRTETLAQALGSTSSDAASDTTRSSQSECGKREDKGKAKAEHPSKRAGTGPSRLAVEGSYALQGDAVNAPKQAAGTKAPGSPAADTQLPARSQSKQRPGLRAPRGGDGGALATAIAATTSSAAAAQCVGAAAAKAGATAAIKRAAAATVGASAGAKGAAAAVAAAKGAAAAPAPAGPPAAAKGAAAAALTAGAIAIANDPVAAAAVLSSAAAAEGSAAATANACAPAENAGSAAVTAVIGPAAAAKRVGAAALTADTAAAAKRKGAAAATAGAASAATGAAAAAAAAGAASAAKRAAAAAAAAGSPAAAKGAAAAALKTGAVAIANGPVTAAAVVVPAAAPKGSPAAATTACAAAANTSRAAAAAVVGPAAAAKRVGTAAATAGTAAAAAAAKRAGAAVVTVGAASAAEGAAAAAAAAGAASAAKRAAAAGSPAAGTSRAAVSTGVSTAAAAEAAAAAAASVDATAGAPTAAKGAAAAAATAGAAATDEGAAAAAAAGASSAAAAQPRAPIHAPRPGARPAWGTQPRVRREFTRWRPSAAPVDFAATYPDLRSLVVAAEEGAAEWHPLIISAALNHAVQLHDGVQRRHDVPSEVKAAERGLLLQAMRALQAAFAPHIPTIPNPRYAVNALWVAAKVGCWGPGFSFAEALLRRLRDDGRYYLLQAAKAQSHGNMWWAVSELAAAQAAEAEAAAAAAGPAAGRVQAREGEASARKGGPGDLAGEYMDVLVESARLVKAMPSLDPAEYKPQELANMLLSAARLEYRSDPDLIEHLLRHFVAHPGPFKPQAISNVLYALGELYGMGSRLDGRETTGSGGAAAAANDAAATAAMKSGAANGDGAAASIGSGTAAGDAAATTDAAAAAAADEDGASSGEVDRGHRPLPWPTGPSPCLLAKPCAQHLRPLLILALQTGLHRFKPQELSNMTYAIAKLRVKLPAETFFVLEREGGEAAEEEAEEPGADGVDSTAAAAGSETDEAEETTVVLRLTRLQASQQSPGRELEQQQQQERELEQQEQQQQEGLEVAVTLPQDPLRAALRFVTLLGDHLADRIRAQPGSFVSQALCNSTWALVTVGYTETRLYDAVIRAAISGGQMWRAKPQEWAILFWSLAEVRHQPPRELASACLDCFEPRGPWGREHEQAWTVLLWGLTQLDLVDERALVWLLSSADEMLQHVYAPALSSTLWAMLQMEELLLRRCLGFVNQLIDALNAQPLDAFDSIAQIQMWQAHLELQFTLPASGPVRQLRPDLVEAARAAMARLNGSAGDMGPMSSLQLDVAGCALFLMVSAATVAEHQQWRRRRRSAAAGGAADHAPEAAVELAAAGGGGPVRIVRVEQEYLAEEALVRVDICVWLSDGRRVAIEVDGPTHYLRNRPYEPVVRARLRNRQLERVFGRDNVVNVPYWEWDEKETIQAKREYLSGLLGLER